MQVSKEAYEVVSLLDDGRCDAQSSRFEIGLVKAVDIPRHDLEVLAVFFLSCFALLVLLVHGDLAFHQLELLLSRRSWLRSGRL